MILQVGPEAPILVRAALAGVLYLHIGAAFTALASGATAILAGKGGRLHRRAGTVFFVAMLVMAGIGAATAPFLPQRFSSVVGLLTFYLVATGWAAVKRPPGQAGGFETGALVAALGMVAAIAWLGWVGAHNPHGRLDGLPYQPAYGFGAIAVMAAAGDLNLILRGGVAGRYRLTRHLWRMCVALLITTLSFVGQPKAYPEAWRGSPLLFLPILVVAGLTLFWAIRTRFPRARPAARPSAVQPARP